jgi:uncharacterized membrane protein
MSIWLHNIKYRWMAFMTIFATIPRVLFIDMAQLDAGFRIVLFCVVGGILVVVSLFYTRQRRKTTATRAD